MRYLFAIFLIALLPLRSLAGDAMALNMTAQQAVMAQAKTSQLQSTDVEASVAEAADVMSEECAMHDTAGSGESSPLCGGCDTCDLCLAAASFNNADLQLSSLMPALERVSSNPTYTSADSASGLKPPIS